jgi:hypothetical protein
MRLPPHNDRNIINKIKKTPRSLAKQNREDNSNENTIRIISTFGCDEFLVKTFKSVEMLTPFKFQFVKKTAAKFRNKLCHPKSLSWNQDYGTPRPCARKRCQCCKSLSTNDYVIGGDGKSHKVMDSGCTSDLAVYGATCHLCGNLYVGKTTNMIAKRKSKHKSDFKKVIEKGILNISVDDNLDSYALGLHLYKDHGLHDPESFDNCYSFSVLEHCTPGMLDLKEHFWIQKCKTITPMGLNLSSPFGIPMLH